MERKRAPLRRQFFLRRRLNVRDCDISFITSWAIPRIRNIASPRGGKETISSLHNSGNNRRAKGRTNAFSQCEPFFGDMEQRMGGSTVLLLPHCCYWKGDTTLTEVLQHAQCRGERRIGIYTACSENHQGVRSLSFFV